MRRILSRAPTPAGAGIAPAKLPADSVKFRAGASNRAAPPPSKQKGCKPRTPDHRHVGATPRSIVARRPPAAEKTARRRRVPLPSEQRSQRSHPRGSAPRSRARPTRPTTMAEDTSAPTSPSSRRSGRSPWPRMQCGVVSRHDGQARHRRRMPESPAKFKKRTSRRKPGGARGRGHAAAPAAVRRARGDGGRASPRGAGTTCARCANWAISATGGGRSEDGRPDLLTEWGSFPGADVAAARRAASRRPHRVRVAARTIHGRGRAEAPLLREGRVPATWRPRRRLLWGGGAGTARRRRRAPRRAVPRRARPRRAARREDEGRRLGHWWRFREVRHGRRLISSACRGTAAP